MHRIPFAILFLPALAAAAQGHALAVRYLEPEVRAAFEVLEAADAFVVSATGEAIAQREGHPRRVSMLVPLEEATTISFTHTAEGFGPEAPIRLLDAAGRLLWESPGGGPGGPVVLGGLVLRGLVVFQVEHLGPAPPQAGAMHRVDAIAFSGAPEPPAEDADGFLLVETLDELRGYASFDGMRLRLSPGEHRVETAHFRHFIELTGSGNHWDLSGAVVTADMDLYRSFGFESGSRGFYCLLSIVGDGNTVVGGTLRNHGDGHGISSRNKMLNIIGSDCEVRGMEIHTSGSAPWGYGSLFGISGPAVRKMNGVRIGQPAVGSRLVDCRVEMRAMGHAVFIQGAVDTLVAGCVVQGLLRPTDEILAQTSGIAFDRGFLLAGYGEGLDAERGGPIPPGQMISLSEDGIRVYGSNEGVETGPVLIIGCRVDGMRRGVCTGLGPAADLVVDTIATNCTANGFNVGSGDVLLRCKADAKHSEALCLPYFGSQGAVVELEVLDSRGGLHNTLLAKINGEGHTVRLSTADPEFVPDGFSIEFSTWRGYGGFQRGEARSLGSTLVNATPAAILFEAGASGNAAWCAAAAEPSADSAGNRLIPLP